jgi:phosphoglycolate phosphatase-like HAD superfamily hydrolase
VIGDAPGDVECALADGAFVVALLGHFDRDQLAGAHAYVDRLAGLGDAIDGLGS